MKEVYLYISSNSSKDIYPSNSANDFRVKLPQSIYLNHSHGSWAIGLLDLDLPQFDDGYKPQFITLESSSCVSSVYRSSLKPILQLLYLSEIRKGKPIRIANPRYVKLNTRQIDSLDLYFRDDTGHKPSFKDGPVNLTLHITQEETGQ